MSHDDLDDDDDEGHFHMLAIHAGQLAHFYGIPRVVLALENVIRELRTHQEEDRTKLH